MQEVHFKINIVHFQEICRCLELDVCFDNITWYDHVL